ncbi:MAG TPA: antibiotic biosynthesis monooxygenase [Anaerolineales bacterium]|nr:antibiotic biosynthesis monooxygenase [Anaerolineales bacterium]
MSEPLIYISTWRIKEGRLEDFKRFIREMVEIYRTNEPQLIAFNVFLNEEETEMTSIQVHPDADSMDFHMQVLERALGEEMSDWVGRADFIEPKHIEIYGTPSAGLLEADQPLVESGIARSVKPLLLAGFTRATTG